MSKKVHLQIHQQLDLHDLCCSFLVQQLAVLLNGDVLGNEL
jgi:hypothetical protein